MLHAPSAITKKLSTCRLSQVLNKESRSTLFAVVATTRGSKMASQCQAWNDVDVNSFLVLYLSFADFLGWETHSGDESSDFAK
mmetsp:Transcript_18362/g.60300  ORF Transcript_18362/g.60300 Transcript_18362/m.60300 type:complete len:83 (+) Transcript_18362:269-517(+)